MHLKLNFSETLDGAKPMNLHQCLPHQLEKTQVFSFRFKTKELLSQTTALLTCAICLSL